MNLQLSLITKWFELSEPDQKTEDYRSITPYWYAQLCLYDGKKRSKMFWEFFSINNGDTSKISFVKFTTNTLTKGYPPKEDMSRKKVYEHKGIEIRKGREEWGAEPGKLYFVIKHGKRL